MLCDYPIQFGSQNNLEGYEFQPSKSEGLDFQNRNVIKKNLAKM